MISITRIYRDTIFHVSKTAHGVLKEYSSLQCIIGYSVFLFNI